MSSRATSVSQKYGNLKQQFVKLSRDVLRNRMEMGRLFNEMCALPGYSQQAVVTDLRSAFANDGKDVFGYVLNSENLRNMALAHEVFVENGGIEHGKHIVTPEELEALSLTPTEAADVARAVQDGTLRIKTLAKQVVKAQQGSVQEAKEYIQGILNPAPETDEQRVQALRTELAKVQDTIRKARQREANIQAAIDELVGAPIDVEVVGSVPEGEEQHVPALAENNQPAIGAD